jgi:hypothetical protein
MYPHVRAPLQAARQALRSKKRMHLRSMRVVCVTLHESIVPYDRLESVTKTVTNFWTSMT